jgi:hypothetical protein
MAKNKFLAKTIINPNGGKPRTEKELIIDDFGGMSSATDTLARDGIDIVHKHYVFSCGEVGEYEKRRYSKSLFMNSLEYNELNNRLLQAGL